MRHLRWVRLVFSLLIVGVLGGLMAPLPSEAVIDPTLTFAVDSTAPVDVHLSSGCAIPAGYRACYTVTTGGVFSGTGPNGDTQSFSIGPYLSGVPQVLVADSDGSGLDSVTLTSVEFFPCVSPCTTKLAYYGTGLADVKNKGANTAANKYGYTHTLTLVLTHKFDAVSNPVTSGSSNRYAFALRTSGQFTPSVNASGDYAKLTGVGIFGSETTQTPLLGPPPPADAYGALPACESNGTKNSQLNFVIPATTPPTPRTPPSDVNYCPLQRTFGLVGTGVVASFSTNPALEQVATFPNYDCNNGSGGCTPTVILTMLATVNGADTLQLVSSLNGIAGSCNLDNGKGGAGGTPNKLPGNPALPCNSNGKNNLNNKIKEAIATDTALDAAAYQVSQAVMAPACEGADCICQDPTTCPNGVIVINKTMTTQTKVNAKFDFAGTGAGIDATFSINTDGLSTDPPVVGTGSTRFTRLVTDALGGSRTITETGFPFVPDGDGDHDSFWYTRDVSCVSASGFPSGLPHTTWTTVIPYFTLMNNARHELGNNPPPTGTTAVLRQGKVDVSNLAAGDTLTCTFDNKIFHD